MQFSWVHQSQQISPGYHLLFVARGIALVSRWATFVLILLPGNRIISVFVVIINSIIINSITSNTTITITTTIMFIFSEVQVAPSACLRSKQRLRGNLHGLVPLPLLLCLQVWHHAHHDEDDEDEDGEDGEKVQELATACSLKIVIISVTFTKTIFFAVVDYWLFPQVCQEPFLDHSRLIWGAVLWQWRLSKPPIGRWQFLVQIWDFVIDLLVICQMLWSLVHNAKSCNRTQHPHLSRFL